MDVVSETAEGAVIDVRVVPRAARSGVTGLREGALLVHLHAPPVEGAANDELVEVLARLFGVPRRSVAIVAGAKGRLKRVRIAGLTKDAAHAAIASRLPD